MTKHQAFLYDLAIQLSQFNGGIISFGHSLGTRRSRPCMYVSSMAQVIAGINNSFRHGIVLTRMADWSINPWSSSR